MPIYEYACEACGHHFEEKQSISDAPIEICPKCSKKKAQRIVSQSSFALKGGGWYADGYGAGKTDSKKTVDTKKTPEKTAATETKTADTTTKTTTPSKATND